MISCMRKRWNCQFMLYFRFQFIEAKGDFLIRNEFHANYKLLANLPGIERTGNYFQWRLLLDCTSYPLMYISSSHATMKEFRETRLHWLNLLARSQIPTDTNDNHVQDQEYLSVHPCATIKIMIGIWKILLVSFSCTEEVFFSDISTYVVAVGSSGSSSRILIEWLCGEELWESVTGIGRRYSVDSWGIRVLIVTRSTPLTWSVPAK